ncbi:MAG: multidrug transporter, partial [Acidithiobacillus caldus]|nr:multidrug transporter [Acidithiobacillus caldus]
MAFVLAGWWYLYGRKWVSVDDAYVQGNKYPITAQVSGQVDQVLAYDTEAVRAGQVLVRLRARRLVATLQAAKDKVARERDEAEALLAQIDAAQARVQALSAQLVAARARSQRLGLAARSGASAELDAIVAQQRVQELQSQRREAEAELVALKKQLGEHGPAAYPPLRQAQAELTLARIDWQRRSIRAPVAGILA